MEGTTYSPRNVTNCKSFPLDQWHHRQKGKLRRGYKLCSLGMEGQKCLSFTMKWSRTWITNGRSQSDLPGDQDGHPGLELTLRPEFHRIFTSVRLKFPKAQYFTVYEFDHFVGVHLHIVMKRVEGLDLEWLQSLADRSQVQIEIAGFQVVSDPEGWAGYVTKQVRDAGIAQGWPRGFRIFSHSRKWYPEWKSRAEWKAEQHRKSRS